MITPADEVNESRAMMLRWAQNHSLGGVEAFDDQHALLIRSFGDPFGEASPVPGATFRALAEKRAEVSAKRPCQKPRAKIAQER